MTAAPISRHQRQMLIDLVANGHGTMDRVGRVCVGPTKAPINGDAIAWLGLVSSGLVAGERGLIFPTDEGRELVEDRLPGYSREAQA